MANLRPFGAAQPRRPGLKPGFRTAAFCLGRRTSAEAQCVDGFPIQG